jgi:hypothetical protein
MTREQANSSNKVEHRQLEAVGDAQFVKDVGDVALSGVLADGNFCAMPLFVLPATTAAIKSRSREVRPNLPRAPPLLGGHNKRLSKA